MTQQSGNETGTDFESLADPYRALFAGDWQAASLMWEKLGAPFERGLALLEGDEEAQREALAVFEVLGARPVAQHVRNMMRRKGIGRGQAGDSGTLAMGSGYPL